MKTYYTLLARTAYEPWRIEFGAYDFHEVLEEKASLEASGDGLKIIRTDDEQASIEAAVFVENERLKI